MFQGHHAYQDFAHIDTQGLQLKLHIAPDTVDAISGFRVPQFAHLSHYTIVDRVCIGVCGFTLQMIMAKLWCAQQELALQ